MTIQRSLVVNDVRLHVTQDGHGPLVLLIHGFPATAYSWRRQLPALAAAGYQAVAVNVRGYGRLTGSRSAWGPSSQPSIDSDSGSS